MSIRWLPVVTLAVFATDAAVLAFGIILLPFAPVAIVPIELPLAASLLVRYVKLYEAERANGAAGALIRVADRDPLLRVALGSCDFSPRSGAEYCGVRTIRGARFRWNMPAGRWRSFPPSRLPPSSRWWSSTCSCHGPSCVRCSRC